MPALRIRDDIGSGELRRQVRREHDGRVSARLIAIANALDGMDRARAARPAGMDRQTLRDRVHRYNAEGIAGLCNRPPPGRTPKLSEGQMASLKAIVLAGPDPSADQVGRWRIVDLCRYVEERWDVSYSETAMLRLLWSLDLSHRKTRPRHPRSDEKAQSSLQKRGYAACLNEIAKAHPEAERLEIWSQDEARVGQKGRTGYVWWQRGQTPRGRRDVGYQSAWIVGAVCPV
jgi:transposase